ncbi:ABC transporter ATP-binding protein [Natronospora cellulosivora (SeqCode)]
MKNKDLNNEKHNTSKELKEVIKVKNLSFTYPGKKDETLKGFSFSIKKGEIFGFLGPSGAGKSTTQKIITGILKGFQGDVNILDQDISKVNNDFYENIGVSFEFPNLYLRFTARENLEYFASLYQVETEDPLKLLKIVGLADWADMRVEEFSKGMKMRLNFCRALLNKGDLIFLDEPTSGLDPANARIVKDIIKDLSRQGKTVFLTTHDMKAVEDVCHRVAFIVGGNIDIIDSPDNLKSKYGNKKLELRYKDGKEVKTESFDLPALGKNKDFWNLLQKHDAESIHSQEADLEEVFIKVTGRKLR